MAACASMRTHVHSCAYVDEVTFARAAAPPVCLVCSEHPVVLFGGWWIKPSQTEGGTGSVRALLASLSSGRHWEWLADPLLALVRHRNPSSWLKCHLIADNWLIAKHYAAFFSMNFSVYLKKKEDLCCEWLLINLLGVWKLKQWDW